MIKRSAMTMMNRGKSKKNQPRVFNILDIVIAVIVAVVLFYVVYVSILGNSIADLGLKKFDIQYTLTIENADYEGFSTLSEGEAVMSKDGRTELGKIVSLKFHVGENGYSIAEITVEASGFSGSDAHDEFKNDDTVLTPGEEVSVRFAEYSPSKGVICTDIKVK